VSISQAIQTARTGLQISGLRAELVATNVANSTTPGYVRRSLDISEIVAGGQSSGVRADGVARHADTSITSQRRNLSSDQASASVLSSTWQTLSFNIGNTVDGDGLFSTLTNFETALADAALTPESNIGLANILNTSQEIVNDFAGLSNLTVSLRSEADSEIANGVELVNSGLERIESLNESIANAGRYSSEAAALFDERGRVLDTISEYLPVQAVQHDDGTIDVVTSEGVTLVSDTARTIEFNQSFAFGPSQSLENGDLSGISVGEIDITPGASSFGAVSSGMFGALFQLRDRDLPEFSTQLDTLATDLVSRYSNDTVDPTKTPGDPGLFVDGGTAGTPGLASRLRVNAAVDPDQGGAIWRLRDGLGTTAEGPPGNADILNNLLNAATSEQTINVGQLQGQFSVSGIAAEVSSLTGHRQVSLDALNTSTQTQLNILSEAELAQSGVDIDDQMQNLFTQNIGDLRTRIATTATEAVTGRYADLTTHLNGQIGDAMLTQKALDDIESEQSRHDLSLARLGLIQQSLETVQEANNGISVRLIGAIATGNVDQMESAGREAKTALDVVFASLGTRLQQRQLFSGDATSSGPLQPVDELLEDVLADGKQKFTMAQRQHLTLTAYSRSTRRLPNL